MRIAIFTEVFLPKIDGVVTRVVRTLEDALSRDGGLAVLRGNLAPGGAIIKQSAATPALSAFKFLTRRIFLEQTGY